MNSPVIWFGQKAKSLKAALQLGGNSTISSGNSVPSVIALAGEVGDAYLSTYDAGLYLKQDSGTTTNWQKSGIIINLTPGSVPFAGSIGSIVEDNANFFWNNTTKRLGIGTNTPSEVLDVVGNGIFTGTLTASNLSGTNTGDMTVGTFSPTSGINGLDISGSVITLQPADASHSGGLSSSDWNLFNSKEDGLGFIPEDVANKDTNVLLGGSNTSYPSQLAVKTYVDTGLATKENSLGFTPANKAGDTITGDFAMSGNKITGLADPTTASGAATKNYVDLFAQGIIPQTSNIDTNIIADNLSTPPGSPVSRTTYLIGPAPTGAWTAIGAGHLTYWDGTTWIDALNRVVQIGDRLGVNFEQFGVLSGGLVGHQDEIATITNATPGSYAYTFETPLFRWTTSDINLLSESYGNTYFYTGSLWFILSNGFAPTAGDAININANKINVKVDSTSIGINGSNQLTVAGVTRSTIATGTPYRVLANTNTGALGENAALGPTSIPYIDANGQLATDVTNLNWDSNLKKLVANSIDFSINLSTTNFYVATTGSDSNDGLTALTPFLTIGKALDSIPMFMGGVYQVNIANGTYTPAATYELGPAFAKSGIVGTNRTVIKIVGNAATPASVVWKGPTSTTDCLVVKGSYVYVDIDGITFDTCATGLTFDSYSRGIIRGINVTNFRTTGWLITNFAIVITDSTNIGGTITSVTGLSNIGISVSFGAQFTCSKQTITISNQGGTGIGILVSALASRAIFSTTTLSVTSATTQGSCINVGSYCLCQVRNTVNLTGTSGLNQAGIMVAQWGFFSVVLGTVFNLTTHQNAVRVLSMGLITANSGTPTFNYTACSTKLVIQEGAVVDSANQINAVGSITYLAAVGASPVYGYDNRYTRVFRESWSKVPCSDVDRFMIAGSNVVAGWTGLTAPRNFYLPTVASATTDLPANTSIVMTANDETGNCTVGKEITCQVVSGGTIDGAATYVLNTPFASQKFYTYPGATGWFTLKPQVNTISCTRTNDSASLGTIGEFIEASSTGVSVGASAAITNVTSISLTAGDWDVEGTTCLSTSGTTADSFLTAISLTTGATDLTTKGGLSKVNVVAATNTQYLSTGTRRISLAATTTVYLVGAMTYSVVGTASYTTDSHIRARRAR